jgi:excisionase family DNA binding protein
MTSDIIPQIGIPEAAKLLGVSWNTANGWVHSGRLHAVKVGGRYRTTVEWIAAVASPVTSVKPDKGVDDDCEGKAALKRIEARFGRKVPNPKLRKNRRATGGVQGVLCVTVATSPSQANHVEASRQ